MDIRRSCLTVWTAILLVSVMAATATQAEEYIIGPEDELQISFWQDPTLDQRVTVRQDGKITLSIIGEITATGLTPRALADHIERSVSLYNSKISQATVTVVGFNSQKIYLSGEVITPGKRSYEVIPDLWTVIKEAGGADENGDLTRVTIVRSPREGGEVITVNILEAVSSGNINNLPILKPGDTVDIPRVPGGVTGRQLSSESDGSRNLFYVVGQVRNPGAHSYEGETDILDALGTAGGPTELANLKKVRVISKTGSGSSVITVNLKEYQEKGQSRRILVKPEDMIVLSEKGRPIISWEVVRDIAALATAAATIVLLIDSNNNSSGGGN